MNTVKERANAKINLFLDVIGKADNGFHDIKTVMHSVDLYDTITVTKYPCKERIVNLYLRGNRRLPCDEKNLAYKAASLFMEYANVYAKVNIMLEKHIPVAAGLAGGSSDAAAVLRAMNKLFDRKFPPKILYKIAAELGSDVPYCLYGKTALCEGRGEIMTKLPDTIRLNTVVAIGQERMSTPHAYAALDELYSDFDGSVATDGERLYADFISAFSDGVLCPDAMYNIFESAVFPVCASAEELKRKMLSNGARAAMMSGSGPSVFGIFDTYDDAKRVCEELRSEKILAFTARSVL